METEAIAAFDLLSRMRFACGDNGKRMQDELEEYLRDLKRDADMWRAITAGMDAEQIVTASVKYGDVYGVLRDAERYRWICDGNGYFMEERGLCGHYNEKDRADQEIDAAMRE